MGLGSYPLFAKPANIVFLPKKMNVSNEYSFYIEDNITDVPITTGDFMKKIIALDEMRIYGYLTNTHVKVWECFLTEILEQNPRQKKIEFHFYCSERGIAFYFKAERNKDKIEFSTMIGSVNDGAYHDVSFEDNDENEYSIDELADMNKEDAFKCLLKDEDEEDEDDENAVFVNYKFNEETYKIVYNIQDVIFEPYVSPYSY